MNETILAALLAKAKLTLRITTNAFDSEIEDILKSGWLDLETRGITIPVDTQTNEVSPLVVRAIMTYVRYHFGEPDNPDMYRKSYIEQRGQLMITSGYTNWGGV